MADFSALKTSIQNYIKQNGNNEITGAILQQILLSMVTALGDNAINDLVTALGDEVAARQNADGTLQDNIDDEATARSQADGTLQQNINNEAAARGNADTQLGNRITSEAEAREGADNALGTRIDNEATARGNADTAIQNAINAINTKLGEGYVYIGIATTSTNPSTPSGKVFYIATAAGIYTNFLNSSSQPLVLTQGINILKYNGTSWTVEQVIAIDDTPTDGSNNLVKSGGVYPLAQKVSGGYDVHVSSHVTETYIDVSLFSGLEAGKTYNWNADKPSYLFFRNANHESVANIPSNSYSTNVDFVMPDLSNATECLTYQNSSPKDFNFKIQTYVKGLEEKLSEETERAKDVEDDINSRLPQTLMPLFIGKVVQKDINIGSASTFPNQLVDSNYYVSMNDYLVVPQKGLRLHITLPVGLKCTIQAYEAYSTGTVNSARCAIKEGTASTTILTDGDIANLYESGVFYRAKFFYDGTTTPITPETVQPLIDNGSILIEYETNDAGIISRNSSRETEVKAVMMRDTQDGNANIFVSSNHGGFTFVHASDIHGDTLRWKNVLDYAQEIGADAVLTTGDYCLDTTKDGLDYFASIVENHPAGDKVIPAMGNHDMAKNRATIETLTEEEAFALVMQPFVTMGNISASKTYYYKDIQFRQPNIGDLWNYRVIVLNTYDGSDWTKSHIGQQQINFFINALSTIPTKTGTQKYGVIVMIHGLEYDATAYASAPLTKIQSAENFFQTKRRNAITGMHDTPISKIVDAWQSRTTLQTTFTNNDDATVITIDADFTSVDAGAEFICFLSGHEHYDIVGYNPNTTNLQLVLNINSAAGLLVPSGYDTLASSGDLPRDGKGVTQDSFNVVTIDRQNGRVKIMRVGADTNVDLIKRNYCIAPYK